MFHLIIHSNRFIMSTANINSNISDVIVTLTNDLSINDEKTPIGNSISTPSQNEPSVNKVVRPDILTHEYSKGHTTFEGLDPKEIELYVEYYDNEKKSLENFNEEANANNDSALQRESDFLWVPLSTLIAQFVLNYSALDQSKDKNSALKIVNFIPKRFLNKYRISESDEAKDHSIDQQYCIKKSAISLDSQVYRSASLDRELKHGTNKNLAIIQSCVLPALYIPSHDLCITGLCSVLRFILKCIFTQNNQDCSLLGFQNSCLSAPAEVSLWTRFCEIDLPIATRFMNEAVIYSQNKKTLCLPEEFAKFETHLIQPVRMNNIRKRMQREKSSKKSDKTKPKEENGDSKDPKINPDPKIDPDPKINPDPKIDPIKDFALTQHVYAEGPDCVLSDLILFVHYYLNIQIIDHGKEYVLLEKILPNTIKWFKKVSELGALKIAQRLLNLNIKQKLDASKFILPVVPDYSLYKSDPKRANPASKIYTRSTKGMYPVVNV